MATIAVIGARGFAGSFVAADMSMRGHRVVPVNSGDALPDQTLDTTIDCNGDARRFWANENPERSFCANVLSVAERVQRMKCRTYVYLSSVDVYGELRGRRRENHEDAAIGIDGLDTYGFHKYLAEQIVAFSSARPLILRLGTLIGRGLKKNPVFDACHGLPIRQTTSSTLSLLSLKKMGEAIEALLEVGASGIFNVTGASSITVARMLEVIGEVRGNGGESAVFHDELLATDYDISISKVSPFVELSSSEVMLREYLTDAPSKY